MILPVLAAGSLLGTACSANPAPVAPGTDPASIARQDTAVLLDAFVAPPGAVRSATAPAGTPSALRSPAPEILGSPTSAQSTGWWVVDGSADEVYAWVKSHDVHNTELGVGSGLSPDDLNVSYVELATPVLFNRRVDVDVAPFAAGRSVLRVTVTDIYRPAKPAAEVVPVTAYLLATVQPARFGPVPKPVPSPTAVTVTDQAKITEIAGLINALPTLPDMRRPCPSDSGQQIRLEFKTAGEGTTQGVIVIKPGGCANVTVTIAGAEQPTLEPDATTYERVASILGVKLNPH